MASKIVGVYKTRDAATGRLIPTPITDRFWPKVSKDHHPRGCWEWLGAVSKNGRGAIHWRGQMWIAYRVSYVLTHGEIPSGLLVCHSCDNPACVNPAHLWLGTNSDNLRDMREKGRSGTGEENTQAKLKADQVLDIRKMRTLGNSAASIARKYGVSRSTVAAICAGQRWKHI